MSKRKLLPNFLHQDVIQGNALLNAQAARAAMARHDQEVAEAAAKAATDFKLTGGVEHPVQRRDREVNARFDRIEAEISGLRAAIEALIKA